MSKTNLESFVNQFVAIVSGDTDKAAAEKAYRQRVSALKSHISSYQGDTIDLEDAVEAAEENLVSVRLNGGKAIENRKDYIKSLFKASENKTDDEEKLEAHKAKIAFLEKELAM